jgi:serine O-acetyltransferase
VRTERVREGWGLREAFREDLDRYVFEQYGPHSGNVRLVGLRAGLMSQGMWATAAYRLHYYVRHRFHSRLLCVLPHGFQRVVVALTGIDIDPDAQIGPGLRIPHGGYIVIGPVRIGRNCEIFQGVTLGQSLSTLRERDSGPGIPTLGDRVWVGPGAVVAGEVTVGDDASVGANSLVVRDVPPGGVVLGVPARLVSTAGSFAVIRYREKDSDDHRVAVVADAAAGLGQHNGHGPSADQLPSVGT